MIEDKVKALSRTYAPIVQGAVTSMSFDSNTGAFQLIYQTDRSFENNNPTLIFLHQQYYYPTGFNVLLSSTPIALPLAWKTVSSNYITIEVPFQSYPSELTITVQISPK